MIRNLLLWRSSFPEANDSHYKDVGVSLDFAKGGWSEVDLTGTAYGALDMIAVAEAREPFNFYTLQETESELEI